MKEAHAFLRSEQRAAPTKTLAAGMETGASEKTACLPQVTGDVPPAPAGRICRCQGGKNPSSFCRTAVPAKKVTGKFVTVKVRRSLPSFSAIAMEASSEGKKAATGFINISDCSMRYDAPLTSPPRKQ